MEKAGADPKVLAAIDSARVVVPNGSRETPNKDFLQHISNAEMLMKSKNYPDAANELDTAVKASSGGPESGFVMGQLLRLEQQWPGSSPGVRGSTEARFKFPRSPHKIEFHTCPLGRL
jgi:hypothetical protein